MKIKLRTIFLTSVILLSISFVIIVLSINKSDNTPTLNQVVTNNEPVVQTERAVEPIAEKISSIPTGQTTNELSMPILMYHHIRDYIDENDKIGTNLSVSPGKFASQLDLIQSRGYTTTTFQEVARGQIPAKPIILTFDDGYLNFYQNAFPELRKRDMSAVSYVISGFNGEDYMGESEIKEIDGAGFEIGSHSISHPDLTMITQEKARREILESKSNLENLIGHKVISFCYPAGKENTEVVSLVKEAGYSYATTTKSGMANTQDGPLLLKRYRVNSDTNISSYLK